MYSFILLISSPKKASSISQLKEGLGEEMGIINEDHNDCPFLQLLEISVLLWVLWYMAFPTWTAHGQYGETSKLVNMTNEHNETIESQ